MQHPEELCNCGDAGYDELAAKSQDDVSNSDLTILMSVAHTRRRDWNDMCTVLPKECAQQSPERSVFRDEPKK